MQERNSDRVEDSWEPASDPVVEAYKRHVDRTLLRQNLRRLAEEARRAGQSRRCAS